jgi:hypothetical protein
MLVFPVGVEHALDVSVHRPHHANAREDRRAVMFCNQYWRSCVGGASSHPITPNAKTIMGGH